MFALQGLTQSALQFRIGHRRWAALTGPLKGRTTCLAALRFRGVLMLAPGTLHGGPSQRAGNGRIGVESLVRGAGRGEGRASHQNSGYRAGGRTSEITVTHSEPT